MPTANARAIEAEPTSFTSALRTLARRYSHAQIQAELIRQWALRRELSARTLARSRAVERALHVTATPGLYQALAPWRAALDLKAIERAFEVLRDARERRRGGIVYTPAYLVDYLVAHGLSLCDAPRRGLPRVCDPACGCGGFLVRAAPLVAARYGVSLERVVEESVVGFDVDESALAQARLMLDLLLLESRRSPASVRPRLLRQDSLIGPPEALCASAGARDGFDLVVTNPPYVKVQNLPVRYRRRLEERFGALAAGSYALAPLALSAYLDAAAPGGAVAVITQNNLFTSLAGAPIRRRLQDAGALRRIVDFGHLRIFPDASAYTCLVFLQRSPAEEVEYARVDRSPETALRAVGFSRIRTSSLDPAKWRLGGEEELAFLRKVEATGEPLGRAVRIRVGFATLRDAVFLVRDEDGRCLATLPDGEVVEVERALTRAALKIAGAETEADVAGNSARVLFPYERRGRGYALVPEKSLAAGYPGAYAYLTRCKPLLASRDKGRKDYGAWYAWGRTQGMDAPGPKLVTRTFDARPRFLWDGSDQLFCNGYGLFPRDGTERDLRALQAILNSSVMHRYMRLASFRIGGDYQCYQKNFIERFGVPRLGPTAADELLAARGAEREGLVCSLYGVPAPAPGAGPAGTIDDARCSSTSR